jgi:uncharacterized phage protein (TIGR01671 family)
MREYRFRGKRVDNGEWVFGDLIQVETDCYIWDYDVMDNGVSESLRAYEIWQKVNPATVGQYTGLHDKAGREIWEGDIVTYPNPKCIGAVEFGPYECGKYDTHQQGNGFYIKPTNKALIYGFEGGHFDGTVEVIGNIHDNPDLLTKEA